MVAGRRTKLSRRGVLAMGMVAGAAGVAGCSGGSPAPTGCLPGLPAGSGSLVIPGRRLPQRLALSPDRSRVAAVAADGSHGLVGWEVTGGEVAFRRDEQVARTPVWIDASRVAWVAGGDAAFLDVDSGEASHLPLGHRMTDADDGAPLGSVGLAISADGATLVSAGADRSVRLFAVTSCAPGRVIDLDFDPTTVACTARHLLIGGSDVVAAFDASSGDRVATLTDGVKAPAFGLGDGSVVFAGVRSDYSFASFDPNTWKLRVSYLDRLALSAAVSPGGTRLATFGTDSAVRLHDVRAGGVPRSIELPSRPGDVVFLTEDRFLTNHLDEGVLEWDAVEGGLVRRFELA